MEIINNGNKELIYDTNSTNITRIQEVDEGKFMLYSFNGDLFLEVKDINEILGLLNAVKNNNYKID